MFFFRKSNQFIFVPNLNTNLSRFNIVSSFFFVSFRFNIVSSVIRLCSELFRRRTYLQSQFKGQGLIFRNELKPNFIDFEMIKMSIDKLAQDHVQICLLVSRKLWILMHK